MKVTFAIDKKSLQELGLDPEQAAKDFHEYQVQTSLHLLFYYECLLKMDQTLNSAPSLYARRLENPLSFGAAAFDRPQ